MSKKKGPEGGPRAAVGQRQGQVPHVGQVQLGDRPRHDLAGPGSLRGHPDQGQPRHRPGGGLPASQDGVGQGRPQLPRARRTRGEQERAEEVTWAARVTRRAPRQYASRGRGVARMRRFYGGLVGNRTRGAVGPWCRARRGRPAGRRGRAGGRDDHADHVTTHASAVPPPPVRPRRSRDSRWSTGGSRRERLPCRPTATRSATGDAASGSVAVSRATARRSSCSRPATRPRPIGPTAGIVPDVDDGGGVHPRARRRAST